jgi:RNA polymerase sigma factor (sigma-70 family)
MRSGNDDYDELCCVAYVGLAKAADGYDADVGSFQAYATQMIRGEIMHHWRREARQNGTQQFDGDWDKLMEIVEEDNTEEMIQRVTRYAYELRPRLRTIITRLYLTGKPPTAKELANEFNISEARLSQLKQEAVTLLREMMQKS